MYWLNTRGRKLRECLTNEQPEDRSFCLNRWRLRDRCRISSRESGESMPLHHVISVSEGRRDAVGRGLQLDGASSVQRNNNKRLCSPRDRDSCVHERHPSRPYIIFIQGDLGVKKMCILQPLDCRAKRQGGTGQSRTGTRLVSPAFRGEKKLTSAERGLGTSNLVHQNIIQYLQMTYVLGQLKLIILRWYQLAISKPSTSPGIMYQ